jgi:hypothetical protein
MTDPKHEALIKSLNEQAVAGGLIVRFEKHGVLVICLPIYGHTAQKENHLSLSVEDRPEGWQVGDGQSESPDLRASPSGD